MDKETACAFGGFCHEPNTGGLYSSPSFLAARTVVMIAIRPPEYFPGPAYCALMASCRRFVLADTFQFSRQSFHNRSQLRTPDGRQWITIPLEGGGRGTSIHDARIDGRKPWASRHRRALLFNYRSSPYFEYYEDRVVDLLEHPWDSLGAVTVTSVRLVHALLELDCDLVVASESFSPPPHDLSKAIEAVGAAEPIGILPDALAHDALYLPDLVTVDIQMAPYRQVFPGFVGGLSVLDLLFNLGPGAKAWLLQHMSVSRPVREDSHPNAPSTRGG